MQREELNQFGLIQRRHSMLYHVIRSHLKVILKLFLSLEDKLQAKEHNAPTLLRISVTLTSQLVIYSEQKLLR